MPCTPGGRHSPWARNSRWTGRPNGCPVSPEVSPVARVSPASTRWPKVGEGARSYRGTDTESKEWENAVSLPSPGPNKSESRLILGILRPSYWIKSGTLSPMYKWHGSPKGRNDLSLCLATLPFLRLHFLSSSQDVG